MEIQSTGDQRRSKPILVRLRADTYEWLEVLSKEAGGGVATVVRSILEAARSEGVEVVEAKAKRS